MVWLVLSVMAIPGAKKMVAMEEAWPPMCPRTRRGRGQAITRCRGREVVELRRCDFTERGAAPEFKPRRAARSSSRTCFSRGERKNFFQRLRHGALAAAPTPSFGPGRINIWGKNDWLDRDLENSDSEDAYNGKIKQLPVA